MIRTAGKGDFKKSGTIVGKCCKAQSGWVIEYPLFIFSFPAIDTNASLRCLSMITIISS